MSDKRLINESVILSKFKTGVPVLADRGLNIQELLLPNQVNLARPPFLKKTGDSETVFFGRRCSHQAGGKCSNSY